MAAESKRAILVHGRVRGAKLFRDYVQYDLGSNASLTVI
jgi:hypothetical protein